MFSENQPERGIGWRFEGQWRARARPTAELVVALAVCDGSRQNIREKDIKASNLSDVLFVIWRIPSRKCKTQGSTRFGWGVITN